MTEAQVIKKLDNINTGLKTYVQVLDNRVIKVRDHQTRLIEILAQDVELKIANITAPLLRASNTLAIRATYGTIRVTLHSSPEIMEIILFMVRIYRIISFAVTIFNILQFIGTVWQINQMILAVWPRYRDWFDGLLTTISEMSSYLGWGVDGIGHLINACAGGINVVGGLMGKDWNLMRAEIMERTNELTMQMSRMLQALKDDPGRVLNQLFENRTLLSADSAGKWWSTIAGTITEAVNRAETAVSGTKTIFSHLLALQENMPEMVRRNIPTSLWLGINQANSAIDDYIRPQITIIKNSLAFAEAILGALIEKNAELVEKLANPGDLLLGVDELPEYVKAAQERAVDDVTSREFDFWSNSERSELQTDFDQFDAIDRLLTAPTLQPGFLALEIPAGKTIRGVTAEYKENWFVGDY